MAIALCSASTKNLDTTDAQDDRALKRARVNTLFRDRQYHLHTVLLIESEARHDWQAWSQSMNCNRVVHTELLACQAKVTAMDEQEANRSRNGDDSHDSGSDERRLMPVARGCTTSDFLKCRTLNFKGTKGVVKGTDVLRYNQHFQELELMCRRMFLKESDEVEKYVGGLPDMIQGSEPLQALVEAYESNKIILDTYGDTVTLKRRRDDDADKDEEPFAGPNRGSKRRREEKEPDSASAPKEKATKSAGKSTHRSNLDRRRQAKLLASPTYELLKGSCKSLVELEFHLEEVYKATTDQLYWVNPEGQQYPHNLLKPLPLIPNNRGRRVIPFDHFINNNLEYLRGGDSSRKYTTSVTKTKAADYGHIKWIKDLVPQTIDRTLIDVRMKYLPQSIWRKSDKDRAAAMIQAIDKRLKTRRIMRSLERFVGERLYEGDFRMLQMTI
nr:hypothetical protein [Tanacetum cinerariifolium]